MWRRHLSWLCALALLVVCAGCATTSDDFPIIVFELRCPQAFQPSLDDTHATFIQLDWSSGSEDGNYLWGYNQPKQLKAEGGFWVFRPDQFVLSEGLGTKSWFKIEQYPDPAQIFEIKLKGNLKPGNWSEWRRPDYFAAAPHGTDVGYMLLRSQKPDTVATNGFYSFELRYKLGRFSDKTSNKTPAMEGR